jgi:hypothetical protein
VSARKFVRSSQRRFTTFSAPWPSFGADQATIQQKPKQNKLFGGNSALSSVLNETYQSGEWRDINGGHSFTSDMAQGFSSMNNTMNTANSVVQDVDGNAISMDRLSQTPHGEAVVNALTKDYSQLMQAINNKKRGLSTTLPISRQLELINI